MWSCLENLFWKHLATNSYLGRRKLHLVFVLLEFIPIPPEPNLHQVCSATTKIIYSSEKIFNDMFIYECFQNLSHISESLLIYCGDPSIQIPYIQTSKPDVHHICDLSYTLQGGSALCSVSSGMLFCLCLLLFLQFLLAAVNPNVSSLDPSLWFPLFSLPWSVAGFNKDFEGNGKQKA